MAIQVNGTTVIDNGQNITNVNSYSGSGVATQTEAEDGTNNDQLMTPLRVLESIKKNGGGSTIDKISEDLGILGPLPTVGAWEWNDNPTEVSSGLSGISEGSNYSDGLIGNQLSNYQSSSTISTSGAKYDQFGRPISSQSAYASASASGSRPVCMIGGVDTRSSWGYSIYPCATEYDNYAAFGGTILGSDTIGSYFLQEQPAFGTTNRPQNWDWKVAYNLNMATSLIRQSGYTQGMNTWNINFRNLTELRGGFGIKINSFVYSQQTSDGVVNTQNYFVGRLSFPELTTIEDDHPVIRWDPLSFDWGRGSGTNLVLRLEVPKLNSANLSKLILGMGGGDITTSDIDIITPLSLSSLTTEAINHFNNLSSRFTINISPS